MEKGILKMEQFMIAHQDKIWNLKAHPSQNIIASCSSDQLIKLYSWDQDQNRYKEVFSIKEEHNKTIRCLEFCPDGRYLASGGFDCLIVVWEIMVDGLARLSLEPKCQIEGHENEVKCLSWHCSGDYLASCSRDQTIQVWEKLDDDGGEIEFDCFSVLTGHQSDVKFVKFVKGLTVLVSGSYDDSIKIWDKDPVDNEWIIITSIVEHSNIVWSLDINNNCEFMFSVSEDRTIRLWDIRVIRDIIDNKDSNNDEQVVDIKCLQKIEDLHIRPIYCCGLNSDGDLFVTAGGDNRLNLFKKQVEDDNRVQFRHLEMVKQAHDQDINSVIFQDDRILTAGDDGIIKVWTIEFESIN